TEMTPCELLHTLRWTSRLSHLQFSSWAKDCLVKQGLTTQKAEALLASVVKKTNEVTYNVRLASNFINSQVGDIVFVGSEKILPTKELPGFHSIFILDCVVAKVQVELDQAFTKAMGDVDPHQV
ncbi:unnamed protein product, partial [Owenia fusiformis]